MKLTNKTTSERAKQCRTEQSATTKLAVEIVEMKKKMPQHNAATRQQRTKQNVSKQQQQHCLVLQQNLRSCAKNQKAGKNTTFFVRIAVVVATTKTIRTTTKRTLVNMSISTQSKCKCRRSETCL